jgi:pyruvate,orthophosphate dikinase
MRLVFGLDHDHDLPPEELPMLVGGKAANLAVMASERLPVPPGFVISTEACRAYLSAGWPEGLDAELRAHMRRTEQLAARRFGGAADPLLVSVRSGAPVSMPGMMDTILNLGLNEETSAGLARATGSAALAQDCAARFRLMFEAVAGREPPSDAWEQLRAAIEAVFRSWNSERAKAYRKVEGISGELGTAVTVQAMVFGNSGPDSATGVLFTRNPATGERELFGDVLFDAQGEDVVSGARPTLPVAVLHERMPDVARRTCVTSSSRSSGAGCGCCRSGPASAVPRPRSAWPWRWLTTRPSRSPGSRRCDGLPRSWPTRPGNGPACPPASSP